MRETWYLPARMAEVGVITRAPNPPGVDLDRWRELVQSNPGLRHAAPRSIVNPFTGAPFVVKPQDTDAEIVLGEQPIGAINVSLDDEGELSVWAPEQHVDEVERIATAIAAELGGTYESFSQP